MEDAATKEYQKVTWSNHGAEVEAAASRVTPFRAAFEVRNAGCVLQLSEVLPEFKIHFQGRLVFAGRAVVCGLVSLGNSVMCEVTLDEGWVDVSELAANGTKKLHTGFDAFIRQWQKFHKIRPDYKVVVADIQSFLMELQVWLGQIELGIRLPKAADPARYENAVALELSQYTTPAITTMFEEFERAAAGVAEDLKPVHSAFVKRQLHALLLTSPFLLRTFQKPLGYAGDYEMVNMILRDPCEGDSLFAKILNLWFLAQAPAEAHRNRIQFLADRIAEVTVQAMTAGRKARILSLGCGPACEVQKFLRERHFSDHAEFTLMDFSKETLDYTASVMEQIKHTHRRTSRCHFVRKSVMQIFKEAGVDGRRRLGNHQGGEDYDFVYCAGLFDYLSDAFCQKLSEILYSWVKPGGLFLTTNVADYNPRRLTMEYIMEWTLIYRSGAGLEALKPVALEKGDYAVTSDVTSVNVYFEARKPKS